MKDKKEKGQENESYCVNEKDPKSYGFLKKCKDSFMNPPIKRNLFTNLLKGFAEIEKIDIKKLTDNFADLLKLIHKEKSVCTLPLIPLPGLVCKNCMTLTKSIGLEENRVKNLNIETEKLNDNKVKLCFNYKMHHSRATCKTTKRSINIGKLVNQSVAINFDMECNEPCYNEIIKKTNAYIHDLACKDMAIEFIALIITTFIFSCLLTHIKLISNGAYLAVNYKTNLASDLSPFLIVLFFTTTVNYIIKTTINFGLIGVCLKHKNVKISDDNPLFFLNNDNSIKSLITNFIYDILDKGRLVLLILLIIPILTHNIDLRQYNNLSLIIIFDILFLYYMFLSLVDKKIEKSKLIYENS